jgi:hypothetical protein
MAAPTLKSALNYYLKRPGLTEEDRAHIKRWFVEANDPVWEKLAADARAYGELGPVVEGPYSIFIGAALRARHFAASQTDTPAVQRRQKLQREQQDRSDLLELADKIEDVLRHHQFCRKAQLPQRVPSPTGHPLPELPREAEARRALEWLGREAPRLRQVAEKVPADEPELDWGQIPVRVSRQSGGKGKRNQSRKLGVFMQKMVNCMYQLCGNPRYDAVAMMTNIAFPDADVVAEDVRSTRRPTTGAGRRRSGALSPVK